MHKIPLKTAADLERMRRACAVTAEILDAMTEFVRPGISTEDINNEVHRMTTERGAIPSPPNYKGFPKSVCTSINDVICHGVPTPFEILKAGDIVNVDVTSFKDGFHGDASRMYFVGGEASCSPAARELVHTARQAVLTAIEVVRPGAHVGDIGAAIVAFIQSTGRSYGIVRDYTGHGIGREFHEAPQVIHVGRKGAGDKLLPGMTFTIEPMINAGSPKTVLSTMDGWTVRTVDGSLSAQWEHTVLVTEKGVEILTASPRGLV